MGLNDILEVNSPAVRAGGGGAVAWMTIMGIPQSQDGIDAYTSLQQLASAPADEAWVYACVEKRFKAAVSVPYRVWVRMGRELVSLDDEPDPAGEDLQFLLDNVNPVDMTGSEFRGYTQASRAVWGGCAWKKVRGRISGRTRELYWLPAPDLTAQSDDGRTVRTWQYQPNRGSAEDISPKDVVLFRSFNMRSRLEFLSPLSAARYEIQTNRGAAMHTAATLQNRGVPEGYWQAQKGVEVTRQDTSAIRRFIRGLRGPQNAGKSLVSPDIEYKALALNPKDAEWLAGRKVSRMMVSAVLGVPLLVAGDDDKASVYANFRDAQVAFWRGTMVDEVNGDVDVLNNWLLPEFDPTRRRLVIVPDFSGVEALKPTYADEVNAWGSFVDRTAATPNDMRAYFHLGKPTSWGDQPTPKTQVTLRPDPATLPPLPFLQGGTAPVVDEPTGEQGEDVVDRPTSEVATSLRAFGRLYSHPVVKAFTAFGGPLDADGLLGFRVSDADRLALEAGLTARRSASQIADALEGVSK